MTDRNNRQNRREFTEVTDFARAMRRIAGTPKVEAERREAAQRKR